MAAVSLDTIAGLERPLILRYQPAWNQQNSRSARVPTDASDRRRIEVKSVMDMQALCTQIARSAESAVERLRGLAGSPLELLGALKFQPVGSDPLTGEPLNFVEQLNQTFTTLASFRAVELT